MAQADKQPKASLLSFCQRFDFSAAIKIKWNSRVEDGKAKELAPKNRMESMKVLMSTSTHVEFSIKLMPKRPMGEDEKWEMVLVEVCISRNLSF